MLSPAEALAAANRGAPIATAGRRRVLVVGGGGDLGSELVSRLLGSGVFERVAVVAAQPLQTAMRGLLPLADDDAAWSACAPDTALVVFDRTRHANGRDDAFVAPLPADLVRWARRLRASGVRTLLVVAPHAPGLLPQALRLGLATLDEHAVAALGFERLVLMRPAQSAGGTAAERSWPRRVAAWLLGQLHWMVPQREQPVRAATVARVAARLAARLPSAAGRGSDASAGAATRVLPAEVLWRSAQAPRSDEAVDAWIDGRPLPAVAAPRQRW